MISFQILFLVASYLICAVPFGFILVKIFAKKDIREFGSKNIGATNVARVYGKKLGLATLLLDGFKGAIMIILARFIFSTLNNLNLFLMITAFVAVSAHIYPIYLNFKGGKGVSTTIATLLAIDPVVGVVSVLAWFVSFLIFRTSSISSIISVFSSIVFSIIFNPNTEQTILCIALFCMVLIRHKENIARIISGEEKKF
jgi:glycerol-3-phosphate acyltransferase PlsY